MEAAVESLKDRARALFGACVDVEGPMTGSGAVLRLSGIDLRPSLSPDQADLLFDALSRFRIICLAGQDLASFSLDHFERLRQSLGPPDPPSQQLPARRQAGTVRRRQRWTDRADTLS